MLGFTPAAVRRHLDHLSRAGIIEVKRVARAGAGAGRPARRYVLSSEGQSSLGNDYLDIAALALQQLQKAAGPDAVRAFAVERFAEMERRYAPEIDKAGPDIADRAGLLPKHSAGTISLRPQPPSRPRLHCRPRSPASSCAKATAPSSNSRPASRCSATWKPKCSHGWWASTCAACPHWPAAGMSAPPTFPQAGCLRPGPQGLLQPPPA